MTSTEIAVRNQAARVAFEAQMSEIRQRYRRRRAIRRAGWLEGRAFRDRLPQPRVWARGRRWRTFLTDDGFYDFEPDVRELICEPVQFDRVAMWADPRERL